MTTSTRRPASDGSPPREPGSPAASRRPRRAAGPADPARRRSRWITIGIPALIAYVPLLLTHPGMVGADTKTYLYLDPGKLLAGAPYVWDAQIGLGTVTHQNIGYLFPMGPFYLFFDALGFVPDWVAQRLWLGSVLLAAGLGVRYLLGTLTGTRLDGDRSGGRALGDGAVLTASLAYMLSPYLLDYSARISVILLPWCALPWLIALAAKAVRHGGWRYPAWFAFVVLAVGGINATALLLVGLGPLLWILHAVWVDREATWRQALAAIGRIGVLTLITALWWIAGLWAEGRYGLPVIRYTESYRTVATVSSAPEVLRGLGYWFFYGNDKLGPWIEPSESYTQWLWLLALSYLLPIIALASAALVRWRYRSFFLGCIVIGTFVSVASHPWESPSFLGGIFKEFTKTDAGLSLRSTPRAVPLVVLGTAIFLGLGVEALGRRLPRLAVPAAALACVLIVANIPPMWTNTMVAANLERPEEIPGYWQENADFLQARGTDTRVLEVPGAEFASYRWGNTVDPILPGLMTRGYVARELFAWGSPQSANLVNAFDRRLHEELMDPEAIVPIAQIMGAGDVNVRSDLQYERYRVARPRQLWDLIRRAPGLGEPVAFGPTDPPNRAGPRYTLIDEYELGTDPNLPEPPRVAAFPVEDARPMLRTQRAAQPLLMAGDGEGLVDAASIGLVDPDQPIFYSASLVDDAAAWDRVYGNGADLMVTDSNRRRARRWGALRENTGYTERPGETAAEFDPSDQRLDVFPGAGDDAYTVTGQRGALVTATDYGNPITYTPDDRPANAFDGDPLTAWRVGALGRVRDQALTIELDEPVTTDHIRLLQPITLERTRWLTDVRLVLEGPNGSETIEVEMDLAASRDEEARNREVAELGQGIPFGSPKTFSKLRIEVAGTNWGLQDGWGGLSGVGLAEVVIPGATGEEVVRPPTDLLQRAGQGSADHRLTLLFTRSRSNPAEPVRADEEVNIRRLVTLPTARTFAIRGQARLSGLLDGEHPGHAVDRLLGLPDATQGGVTAEADVHIPGSLEQRASASIDGDPTTFWSSIYLNGDDKTSHWLEYTVPAPVSFDHLDLEVVNDRRHSLPTRFTVEVDGRVLGDVDLPRIERQDTPNGTAKVRVDLPWAVTGSKVRFTISGLDEQIVDEWYSDGKTVTPVTVAEIGIPGVRLPKPAETFDSGCRTDLLAVDGDPIPVRVTGRTADVLARRSMPVEPCPPAPGTTPADGRLLDGNAVRLDAGDHVVRTGIGRDPEVGIDIDRIAFDSAAPSASAPAAAPAASDVSFDRVDGRLTAAGTDRPYWLVLGQSWSDGWTATANGQDLGQPIAVNGYANAWYVDPAVVGTGPVDLRLEWAPQRVVWIFIGLSVLGGLVCLILMIRRPARREPAPLPAEAARPLVPDLDLTGVARLLPRRWAATAVADRADGPDGPPVGWRAALIAAAGLGLFALVLLPGNRGYPSLALPLAALLVVAVRRPRTEGLLALGGALSLAAAAFYTVVQQVRHRFPSDFVWPTKMGAVHILGVLAVLLLLAEAVRELVLRRRGHAEAKATDDGPSPDTGTDAGLNVT